MKLGELALCSLDDCDETSKILTGIGVSYRYTRNRGLIAVKISSDIGITTNLLSAQALLHSYSTFGTYKKYQERDNDLPSIHGKVPFVSSIIFSPSF